MLPCYTCGCVHTAYWALGFLGFLPVLHPPSGSSSPCSCGSSSPLGLPTFEMGSPLLGRGSFVLDRIEGSVSPFGSGVWSVSWLGRRPLSEASLRPCSSGWVSRWSSLWTWASVVLSSLQCSSLSHVMVTCSPPRPLFWVWGCPWRLTLDPDGWGWSLYRRLLFAP